MNLPTLAIVVCAGAMLVAILATAWRSVKRICYLHAQRHKPRGFPRDSSGDNLLARKLIARASVAEESKPDPES